jgi:hypothetical protein
MAIGTSKLLAVQPDASLKQARLAIEAGEKSLKQAAEHLATARQAGASQRQMAEAVGKSAAWVNRLLKWREEGYEDDTPFGPESKAKRAGVGVQAPERSNDGIWEDDENDESPTKSDEAAEKAKEDNDEVAEPKRLRMGEKRKVMQQKFDEEVRRRLIKALSKLGAVDSDERSEAALKANKIRKKSGFSWDDLIVPTSMSSMKTAA